MMNKADIFDEPLKFMGAPYMSGVHHSCQAIIVPNPLSHRDVFYRVIIYVKSVYMTTTSAIFDSVLFTLDQHHCFPVNDLQ